MKFHYTKKLLIAAAVALSMGLGLTSCTSTGTSSTQATAAKQALKLTPYNWDS